MKMEEGYRRGTVLGLTIAEIFILLVFLMLLALLGVNSYWVKKHGPWKDISKKYTPEEVEEALAHPDSLRGEIKILKKQIEKLKKEKERLQERIRILENREGETGKLLDEANKNLQEAKRALAEFERALADADRKRNKLLEKVDSLGNKIRTIGKGITPPCWYQLIEETNPITKANLREKPYYLFDIAIREDHMEVQRLPIPEGSAEDDGGASYAEEAKTLGLDTIPYGVPLSNSEMLNVMRGLCEKGKASQIRTYLCIFYVRVWDETPAGAKERWKQAHDGVLEQLFGTHQVRGTSWKDRKKEPVNVPIITPR